MFQFIKKLLFIIFLRTNNFIEFYKLYPFSIKMSKCLGKYNTINDPYAKICIPDVIKNLNVKLFNLISRTSETRFVEWHEKFKL